MEEAINLYEVGVKQAIRTLNRIYALSVGWAAGTGSLVTAGVVLVNLAPLISGLGLGGIIPALRGKQVINMLITYQRQRSALENSVWKLKIEHLLCRRNNHQDLEHLKNMLREFMQNLSGEKP